MAAEHSATMPVTPVPAVPERESLVTGCPAAADTVRWEFRLTADRRRILVAVNRPPDPE
jgi:hypothetical protein